MYTSSFFMRRHTYVGLYLSLVSLSHLSIPYRQSSIAISFDYVDNCMWTEAYVAIRRWVTPWSSSTLTTSIYPVSTSWVAGFFFFFFAQLELFRSWHFMMLHKEGSEKVGEGIALAFVEQNGKSLVSYWTVPWTGCKLLIEFSQNRQDSSNYT